MRLGRRALLIGLLSVTAGIPRAAAEPGPVEPPVVAQATLGENACGPCAVVNALLRAKAPYADALQSVAGATPLEKAGDLVRRFGQAPSEAYAGEMAYDPNRGITWADLTACVNALLKERQAPPLAGDYLDRRRDEPLEDHLRRVHRLLAASLRKGVPVVTSVRSFAPQPKEGGEHAWAGLNGHYVTITAVQERIDDGEKGFRFTYADSFTGRLETGYAHVDEARNFTAAKGDAKRWEWLTDRPFLLVTAPTLRLSTQMQPWHLRTIITLNYAIYAPE
jgi:hypothetical protein